MVASLVAAQDNPALRSQLEREFQALMTDNALELENTRAQRAAFRRNMQRFVEVRCTSEVEAGSRHWATR